MLSSYTPMNTILGGGADGGAHAPDTRAVGDAEQQSYGQLFVLGGLDDRYRNWQQHQYGCRIGYPHTQCSCCRHEAKNQPL